MERLSGMSKFSVTDTFADTPVEGVVSETAVRERPPVTACGVGFRLTVAAQVVPQTLLS